MLPILQTLTGAANRQRLTTERLAEHPIVATDAVRRVLFDGHNGVRRQLARFALLADHHEAQRAKVVRELCAELAGHLQVEEELLHPRLRDSLRDSLRDTHLVDEAEVEHDCLRDQMERLMAMAPDDPQYTARVMVLAEYFELHLQREQDQMHPLLRRCGLNSRELGDAMTRRRDELLAERAACPGQLRLRPENEDADPVGAPPR